MTLKFMDSFDHYSIPADLAKKYNNVNITGVTASASGRTNGCVNINGASGFLAKSVSAVSGYLIFGFGFYVVSGAAAGSIVGINDRVVPCIEIYRNADSSISVSRHSGSSAKALLGTSASFPLIVDTWHYVEVKAKYGVADGEVIVKVNGTTVLTLTNVNTTAFQDNGPYTAVVLCQSAASNSYGGSVTLGNRRYDDLYICDDTGADNTDFLGQCAVHVVYPTSDSAPNAWTPSAGTDHFAMVDEVDIDDDTTYLEVTDAAAAEVFGFGDSPTAVGSVTGVQITSAVRKSSPGGATYKHQVKQGAITVEGEELGFPSGSVYAVNSECFDKDPTDGVDWTFARVNSLEAGVKRNA